MIIYFVTCVFVVCGMGYHTHLSVQRSRDVVRHRRVPEELGEVFPEGVHVRQAQERPQDLRQRESFGIWGQGQALYFYIGHIKFRERRSENARGGQAQGGPAMASPRDTAAIP